jgi:transposase InsO family protein
MTPFLSTLTNPTTSSTPVRLADSTLVKATHSGQFKIPLGVNTTIRTLVVPSLHKPLLLVGALCDKGFSICFDSTSCKIFKLTDLSIQATQVGEGYRRGNLFYLPSMADVRLPFKFSTVTDVSLSVSVPLLPISFDSTLLGYHCLLLHIGLRPLKAYLRLNGIWPTVMNKVDVQKCTICVQSKMQRANFKTRLPYCSQSPGLIIHYDVCSFEKKSWEGYNYFVTFVDDCSKSVTIYPMKSKNDTSQCFKLFWAAFEKSGVHLIISLRSDNGGEYLLTEFTNHLGSVWIKHKPSPPHSPESNGVAERTNRTVNNLIRCALRSANLPKPFWTDALCHFIHPFNSMPMNTPLGFKSPNSILNLPCVKFNNLHPFGCSSWYKVPKANRKKLDPKARMSIFLSYLSDGNG